ncbi:hypothetical protein [Limnochorda pilosa]|uniref:Uncharacterized protein n=1 Tax=Limnochorda pilosa TaxID=1555112 RepID=A0A0K2SPU7_LIMPI|nr:hypothetical protein [Limnochorda pilosa]BAS28849.1 hypothetical protein LIP_3020 [Limnochorda pilosa]
MAGSSAMRSLPVPAHVPDEAVSRLLRWLEENQWFAYGVVAYDADSRRFQVEEGHADFFLEAAREQGVGLLP